MKNKKLEVGKTYVYNDDKDIRNGMEVVVSSEKKDHYEIKILSSGETFSAGKNSLFVDSLSLRSDEDSNKSCFKEAALPLIKYMAKHLHPHHSAIVTSTGAELLEGKECTGEILDFIVD